MPQPDLILLAALQDILEALLPVIIFIIWAIAQVFRKQNPAKQKGRPPQQPAARPQQPPQNKPAARPEALSKEIDDFLKRAAEKRGARPPAEVEVIEPATRDEPVIVAEVVQPARRQQPTRRPPQRKQPSSPTGRGVAAHVKQNVDTSDVTERASHLGEQIGQTDERLEQRLHDKFDHQVGRLTSQPTDTPAAESQAALEPHAAIDASYDIPDLPSLPDLDSSQAATVTAAQVSPISPIFESPEDLRRAIILNEILRRPTDRW